MADKKKNWYDDFYAGVTGTVANGVAVAADYLSKLFGGNSDGSGYAHHEPFPEYTFNAGDSLEEKRKKLENTEAAYTAASTPAVDPLADVRNQVKAETVTGHELENEYAKTIGTSKTDPLADVRNQVKAETVYGHGLENEYAKGIGLNEQPQTAQTTYTPAVANTYTPTQITYNSYTNGGAPSSAAAGLSQDVYDRMNEQWAASDAVKSADAYTASLLQKLSGGRTQYSDELDNLISQFKNREAFQYDPNSDMLYQNYLTAMQNAGQMAMKDTMGQAAALTGGYGSSYATAAANGAYNNYLQTANDNLVNFYNMALDKYNLEGEQALQGISLTQARDESEYNRLMNEYSAAANRAKYLRDNEYGEYLNRLNQANLFGQMQNSDYWNNAEMQYKTDAQNAQLKYNYDVLNNSNAQWEGEMNFKERQAKQSQDNWEAEQFSQYLKNQADAAAEENKPYGGRSVSEMDKIRQRILEFYSDSSTGNPLQEASAYVATLGDLTEEERMELLDFGEENGPWSSKNRLFRR